LNESPETKNRRKRNVMEEYSGETDPPYAVEPFSGREVHCLELQHLLAGEDARKKQIYNFSGLTPADLDEP